MRRDELFFSVRLAFHDPFVRWVTVGSAVIYVTVTSFFMWSVFSTVRQTGLVTLHYNTYIGIDDVRTWPWTFWIPGIVCIVLLLDTITALFLFQRDRMAARAIVALEGASVVLWAVGMYFLTRINL